MNTETSRGEIILYQTADGKTNIDVKLENDTVWLTQAQMAVLFEKGQSVIARHIKNAIADGEIENSNMQILHNTLSKYKISVGSLGKSRNGAGSKSGKRTSKCLSLTSIFRL